MISRSTHLILPTVLLFLGTTPILSAADKPSSGMTVDKKTKTITIDATIAPRKLPTLKEIYPIEVIATFPADHNPKGQKAHETVVNFTAKPSEVQKALESFGLKPGKPVQGEGKVTGPEVLIFLEFTGSDGKTKRVPIEDSLVFIKGGKKLNKLTWHFTGSAMKQPDPEKDDKVCGADLTGTLITLLPVSDDTVIQAGVSIDEENKYKLETNKELLPKIGSPAKLIIQAK